MLAIILLIIMLLYLSGFTLVLGGSAFLLSLAFIFSCLCQAELMENYSLNIKQIENDINYFQTRKAMGDE